MISCRLLIFILLTLKKLSPSVFLFFRPFVNLFIPPNFWNRAFEGLYFWIHEKVTNPYFWYTKSISCEEYFNECNSLQSYCP